METFLEEAYVTCTTEGEVSQELPCDLWIL